MCGAKTLAYKWLTKENLMAAARSPVKYYQITAFLVDSWGISWANYGKQTLVVKIAAEIIQGKVKL